MDFIIFLIIGLTQIVIGIGIMVTALEVIQGEKEINLKGLVIWIIGVILLLILWSFQKEYFPESTWLIKDIRRT